MKTIKKRPLGRPSNGLTERVETHLTPELRDALYKRAAELGQPKSHVIRTAIIKLLGDCNE